MMRSLLKRSVERSDFWATECQDKGGTLYEVQHRRMVGKTSKTRYDYLCVAQGQAVASHLHGDSM